MEPQDSFIKKVLDITSDVSPNEDLFWRIQHGTLRFFVNCNDVFVWASADAEEILPENLDMLRAAINTSMDHWAVIFCATSRGMRPQNAVYDTIGWMDDDVNNRMKKKIWDILDNCGPEREVGTGNPHERGKL